MKIPNFRSSLVDRCVLALIIGISLSLASGAQAQTNDTAWLGMNANYYDDVNSHLQDLGIKSIRMSVGWQQSGKTSEIRNFDEAKINAMVSAGYKLHLMINYRGYDLNNKKVDAADFETWVANYKSYCRQVITKYGAAGNVRIGYYICGNEPDLNDPFTGNLTATQAYRFSRALWEAKNEVNPALTTESAPVSSPTTNYLRDMINAGVADYTDVVGIHAYTDQFDNGNLRKPWDFLAAAGKSKPISISEAGVPLNSGWQPNNMSDVYWRKRWHQLAYLQAKRYGYDRMLLFTHTGNTDWTDKWAYRDRNNGYAPVQTAYDEVKYGLRKRPDINGGFEANNDRWHEWIMLQGIKTVQEPTWADFASSGARSGSRCLKISSASWEGRDVKRVVSDLTVGAPYTLNVYAKVQSGGTASLRAQGYNRTNGLEEKSDSTSVVGSWTKLSVTFTPTNPWAVIVLASAVTPATGAACYFDDAAVSQNSTTFSGTYKLLARHSGKALTIDSYSTADGGNAIQYGTDSANNRLWIITATSDGYYALKAKHSGKKLSVDLNAASNGSNNGTATGEGANAIQYGTDSANNRQWKIESVGSGYYKLTNRQTGYALEVAGGPTQTADGVNVQQWTYKSGTNQQWSLQKISSSTSAATTSAPAASSAPSGGAG